MPNASGQNPLSIQPSGRIFGRFNVIDFFAVTLALLIALAVILVQSGLYKTSGKMVNGEGDIEYTLYIRNLKTMQPDLFVPGQNLSITIRNQPRGALKIVSVQKTLKKSSYMLPSGNLKTTNDPADPFGYDYLVTVRDHAQFTQDGYVTEGIKVKIGLGIEVEGKVYRIPGSIIDVHEVASDTTTQPAATAPAKQ